MICCVCLLENSSNMEIFNDIGQHLKIPEVINKYLWFKPEPDNGLTTKICTICWHKLDDFHIFYETVKKAHKDYKETLSKVKTEASCSSTIKLEIDCGEEDIIVNDADFVKGNPEIELKNPLEENYNENENCRSSDDSESLFSRQHYKTSINKALLNDNNEKVENGVGTKTKIGQKRRKNLEKDRHNTKKRIFQRLDPVHTEEMIKKHVPMGCNLCIFVGITFSDIVQHFKKDHPKVTPFIMCCDKKFSKRFYLAQHALKHEDPNCFKCEQCNKPFTTTKGLQAHNLAYHARTEDLIYACESCPKKFARRHLLELHQPSHIPKEQWKYICSVCPDERKFASSYLLNIHTNMRHKREINICPVCAKEIKGNKSFEKHVKEHYEGSGPRLKCTFPNCDTWLKDADNLRLHLRGHNTNSETYQCTLCNKKYPNRRALYSHNVYVHSKEVFKCEDCNKTFKRAITLKEHIAQHTGEVLYNCPFCTRTFNSNANMHSHKKKQHPVEWEALRKKKMVILPSEIVLDKS